MKRFYEAVDIAEGPDGIAIHLDGRPVRTPAKKTLRLPSERLARAVAAEWEAQDEEVDPRSMRLTRLANTALDRVAQQRAAIVDEIAAYAETDLVCYRAAEPEELARRQADAWDPLVDWARERHGMSLAVTDGLLPAVQTDESLNAARAALEALDDFVLTAVHTATTACGSVVLGLAVAEDRIDARTAWELSLVDESWQIEKWGEDPEAVRRREGLLAEITAAAAFIGLCRGDA